MIRRLASIGALALAGVAVSEWWRRNGACARLQLTHFLPAEPAEIVDLVRQVEREPEFIPGVERVDILESNGDWIRYQVHLLAGASATFRKTWDGDKIAWASEGGTLGLRQTGLMELQPVSGGTDVHLTVETGFDAPVIGPLATCGSIPYLDVSFTRWLENLGQELAYPK
jgi:hypothetical protein